MKPVESLLLLIISFSAVLAAELTVNKDPVTCDADLKVLLKIANNDQTRLLALNGELTQGKASIETGIAELEEVCSNALIHAYQSNLFLQKDRKAPSVLLEEFKTIIKSSQNADDVRDDLLTQADLARDGLQHISDNSIAGFNAKCASAGEQLHTLVNKLDQNIRDSRDLVGNFLDFRIRWIQQKMEKCEEDAAENAQ